MSNVVQMAIDDPGSTAAHTASIATLIGTAAGYLPVFLALIPAIYYLILIYESRTVQHWVANRKMKRSARKLARLNAAKLIVEAELRAAEAVRLASIEARNKVSAAKVEAVVVAAAADAAETINYAEKCKRRRADGPTPCLLCKGECEG